MEHIILSIVVGTLVYCAVQLFWYSPLGMGHWWLASQNISRERVTELLVQKSERLPQTITHLVLPGILMSAAIVFLELLMMRFGGAVFGTSVVLMWIMNVVPKYSNLRGATREVRLGWLVNDGALALSLVLIAGVVWWMI